MAWHRNFKEEPTTGFTWSERPVKSWRPGPAESKLKISVQNLTKADKQLEPETGNYKDFRLLLNNLKNS